MTRLALAKTIVTGTVTLQGIAYTFTASGSETATADRVPKAKKLAVVASNSAAITAARASIDKILAENSAVLSDLEITSLISNNLSTTVVAFKPIALSSVATTTDGVNYTLNPNTIIRADQWLTVSNGINLKTGTYPFTINGYFQVGDNPSSVSTTLKDITTASVTYSTDASNNGYCIIYPGGSSTIDASITFENYGDLAYLTNGGTFNNYGSIINGASQSYILTIEGTFYNYDGATITNSGPISAIYCYYDIGAFYNYGSIVNSSDGDSGANSSSINNSGSTPFYNYGSITNSGYDSYISNESTFFNYDGSTITNSGDDSYISNESTFYNYAGSTITNIGSYSNLSCPGETFYNYGSIVNSGEYSYIATYSTSIFYNYDGATITNSGYESNMNNFLQATINNYGSIVNGSTTNPAYILNSNGYFNNYDGANITNIGAESYINNDSPQEDQPIGTFYNYTGSTINNSGDDSYVTNTNGSSFTNDGTLTNSGDDSYVTNDASSTFVNDGTITNSGTGSSTTNTGT